MDGRRTARVSCTQTSREGKIRPGFGETREGRVRVGVFLAVAVVVVVLVIAGIVFVSRRGGTGDENEAAGGYYGTYWRR